MLPHPRGRLHRRDGGRTLKPILSECGMPGSRERADLVHGGLDREHRLRHRNGTAGFRPMETADARHEHRGATHHVHGVRPSCRPPTAVSPGSSCVAITRRSPRRTGSLRARASSRWVTEHACCHRATSPFMTPRPAAHARVPPRQAPPRGPELREPEGSHCAQATPARLAPDRRADSHGE